MAQSLKSLVLICVFFPNYSLATSKQYFQFQLKSVEDFEQLESCLQQEPVTMCATFRKEGTQPTHSIKLITLKNGVQGIFKTGEYHYAEVAAYRLNKILKLHLVPPTVFRIIEGVQGSLQLYIAGPDLASFEDAPYILDKLPKNSLNDAKFFYYLAGQWDTHYGNQLIERGNEFLKLWLIDNSGILHRSHSSYGEATFVERGTNKNCASIISPDFPFSKSITIPGDQAYFIFKPYILNESHLTSFAQHEKLSYVIWNSTLWLRHKTEGPRHLGRYSAIVNPSTLEASKILTYENLLAIWAEWHIIDPDSCSDLIKLIIERRNELVDFFSIKS